MVIDFIIIIFFVYFVIVGFRRGFWLSMIHLSATIVSLWIASQFYKSIVERLIVFIPYPKTTAFNTTFAFHFNHLQNRFEAIVAFLMITLFCKFILYLIIVTFDKIIAYQNIHIFSRAMGMIVGVFMTIIVLHFTLYLLHYILTKHYNISLKYLLWVIHWFFTSHIYRLSPLIYKLS